MDFPGTLSEKRITGNDIASEKRENFKIITND
jgi:hypothetical protein